MKVEKTFLGFFGSLFLTFIFLIAPIDIILGQAKLVGPPIDFEDGNEYDPAFSNDGKWLAFVSDKSGQFKLYICEKEQNKWSEPIGLDTINNFNNNQGNIRHPNFNHDGSILYFSADFYKDSSDVDIFYSKNINGEWTEPASLGTPINTTGYDGQPSVSADGKMLFFSRNVTESIYDDFDCKKILLTRKNDKGDWQQPEELPVPINVGCEQCAKVALDNKTVYFSSVRDGGKGGFDVYKTRLIAKNVWVPAESLDTINTGYNDYTPAFSFDSNIAYMTIEQVEKRSASAKIYSTEVPPQFLAGKNIRLTGKITELSNDQPIEAKISIFDPVTSRPISNYVNNPKTGEYDFYLPKGNNYQIDFHKKDYSHSFMLVEAEKLRKNQEINKDIKLYRNIKLILNTFDDEIFKPVDVQIEITNSQGEITNAKIEKIKDGRYRVEIPIGGLYNLALKADYYETLDFDFDLTGIVQFDEFEKDAELKAKKVDFEIDISDEATQKGIPVEVVITNLDNNEVIRTVATAGEDGKYKIKLREGDRYSVSVSPKGYSFYNTTVDLKKKKRPKKLEVKLKELKEDTKLTLNNIVFEVNSDDLNESSFTELDRVVKLMKDNPNINIEISAHTDNVGSEAYNLRLSNRRANSVATYLKEQNVPTNRLISKGYGESSPLYPNDTKEHKALNRRVELKIIKVQ